MLLLIKIFSQHLYMRRLGHRGSTLTYTQHINANSYNGVQQKLVILQGRRGGVVKVNARNCPYCRIEAPGLD